MTAIIHGLASYIPRLGATPEIVLDNIFVETDKTNLVDGHMFSQSPSFVDWANFGP